jgi:predicted RNA-binding Zn ribbon-like protein
MREAPASLSFDHDKPFRYVGGDPSIDLVNTTEWTNRGLERDRLSSYDRLTRWAEGAHVITPADAKRLRAVGAEHPRASRDAYEAARRLRALLQRVFLAVARGTSLESELDQLNAVLADALTRARLTRSRSGAKPAAVVWAWRGWGERLESMLWPVAWSAAALLQTGDVARLRVCDGPECGWMYIDRSRNGLRRWCQMDVCGTKAKTRRRRARARRANR